MLLAIVDIHLSQTFRIEILNLVCLWFQRVIVWCRNRKTFSYILFMMIVDCLSNKVLKMMEAHKILSLMMESNMRKISQILNKRLPSMMCNNVMFPFYRIIGQTLLSLSIQPALITNRNMLDGILMVNELVDYARSNKKHLFLFKFDFERLLTMYH